MAADLDGLIRVRKHALDQRQKLLAELYRQAEELTAQKGQMLEQLVIEQEKMNDFGIEMLSYFGPYSNAVKVRVSDIDDALKILNVRIEKARDDMRAAFNEMKKIEITDERRKAAAQKILEKKESDDLDAIAIEGFQRAQGEGE